MRNKLKVIIPILSVVLVLSLIYFRRKNDGTDHHKLGNHKDSLKNHQDIPPNALIIDLESIGNIATMGAQKRMYLSTVLDNLYETEKWEKEIPAIPMEPNWAIIPQPANRNTVARFNIKHLNTNKVAVVIFDPYGLRTGEDEPMWQVGDEITQETNIPVLEVDQLSKAIQQIIGDTGADAEKETGQVNDEEIIQPLSSTLPEPKSIQDHESQQP